MRTSVTLAACLVAVVFLSAAAGQAWADEPPRVVWMWVDRYGTLSFTDDDKRIPAAYRTDAGRKAIDWPHVTVDKIGDSQRREALRTRLEALRATPPAGCADSAHD